MNTIIRNKFTNKQKFSRNTSYKSNFRIPIKKQHNTQQVGM